MDQRFEVAWEGVLPASAEQVWEAFTLHTAGWLWDIAYEPREGGAERGLTDGGGVVAVWEPHTRFVTRAEKGFNQLEYRLSPGAGGTYLRFTHQGETSGDHDLELDACRRHTAFYYHSLEEYLRHFAGRTAAYAAVDAPEASASGGFAALRRALGVAGDVEAGDRVRWEPAGLPQVEGVVDYATDTFLGVRTEDALYRFYGRDRWGWPVGMALHRFAGETDAAAWQTWLNDLFPTEAVA